MHMTKWSHEGVGLRCWWCSHYMHITMQHLFVCNRKTLNHIAYLALQAHSSLPKPLIITNARSIGSQNETGLSSNTNPNLQQNTFILREIHTQYTGAGSEDGPPPAQSHSPTHLPWVVLWHFNHLPRMNSLLKPLQWSHCRCVMWFEYGRQKMTNRRVFGFWIKFCWVGILKKRKEKEEEKKKRQIYLHYFHQPPNIFF